MVISASECIPIEYIKDQIEEYRKFDHLGMYAEFLDMFIQDYKDNAMANYADRKTEPQTEVDWKQWLCDMYGADRKSFDEAWEKYEAEQTEPIPKDVVVSCGNGNVLMNEDTYDELIEQVAQQTEPQQVTSKLADIENSTASACESTMNRPNGKLKTEQTDKEIVLDEVNRATDGKERVNGKED